MKSKDIVNQELTNKLNIAMKSTDEGAIAKVFTEFAQDIKEDLINDFSISMSAAEKYNEKNTTFEKNIGIKASQMSSEGFRKKFGGEGDMKFSEFAQMIFNNGGGKEAKQQIGKRTDGSIIAPIGIAADIIHSACQKSVLLNNCPIVPMETGILRIGRVNEDLELEFKEKGKEGLNSSLGLETIELNAKTLYGYVELAEEDVQDVYEIDNILLKAFSNAIAKALDSNFLYTNPLSATNPGVYPIGILDNANIQSVTVTKKDYDMVAQAKLKVIKENGDPNTIGINPNELFTLQTLKDTTGQYIQSPEFYNKLNLIESNGLKISNAVVMDSNAVVVGIRKDMDIKIMNDISKGTILMRCMVRADVLPLREKHICKIEITE